jgi:hypothetical protein
MTRPITIHSYRRVLQVRRHIYVIPWSPGKALVLPWPLPLMGLTYCAVLYFVFIIISRLPVLGALADLPWKLWWVAPPVLAYLLITNESAFDQRLPHRWLRTLAVYWFRPKRTRAGIAIAEDGKQRGRIRWFADEHSPELHRTRITGPARVTFNAPVRFNLGLLHRNFEARPDADGKPLVHDVADTDRLEVKP